MAVRASAVDEGAKCVCGHVVTVARQLAVGNAADNASRLEYSVVHEEAVAESVSPVEPEIAGEEDVLYLSAVLSAA